MKKHRAGETAHRYRAPGLHRCDRTSRNKRGTARLRVWGLHDRPRASHQSTSASLVLCRSPEWKSNIYIRAQQHAKDNSVHARKSQLCLETRTESSSLAFFDMLLTSLGVPTLGSRRARLPEAGYSPAARLQAGGEPLWGSSHQECIAQARGSEAIVSRGGRSPLALPPFPEASLCSRARNASTQPDGQRRKV